MFHVSLEYQKENEGRSDFFASWIEKDWYIVPNVHRYVEFFFVRSGTLTVSLNGTVVTVPEGHVAFALPYDAHGFSPISHNTTQYVMHSAELVPLFFQKLGKRRPSVTVIDVRAHRSLFDALLEADVNDTLLVSGLLHLIYATYFPLCDPQEHIGKEQKAYRRAVEYVAENFRQDISLKRMAQELGYHEKYLSAVISNLTNMHFRRFLAMYRISWVCEQLGGADGKNTSMTELALEAGFASVSTFNRMFKELRGITPSEYIKGRI